MGIDRPSGTEKRLDDIGRVPAQERPPPDRPGQPGYPSRLESRRAAREAALVTQQDSQDAGQPPEAAEKSDHDQPTQAESAIGEDAADCAGEPRRNSDEQDRLEGKRDHVVDDPADPGKMITDIDQIENGVLWEEKSGTGVSDIDKWTGKHIDEKFASYLEARRHLVGYEDAPIGFRLPGADVAPEFRSAVESAVERLRASHRGVRMFPEWS